MNAEVLNSWKEIAAYMGRGVRTVQRWEQELGLPVRRPRAKERSAVIALKSDLDRWLQRVPQGTLIPRPADSERYQKLHISTEKLRKRTHEILERSGRMQETVKTTLALAYKLHDRQAQRVREFTVEGCTPRLLVSSPGGLTSRKAPAQPSGVRQNRVAKGTAAPGR